MQLFHRNRSESAEQRKLCRARGTWLATIMHSELIRSIALAIPWAITWPFVFFIAYQRCYVSRYSGETRCETEAILFARRSMRSMRRKYREPLPGNVECYRRNLHTFRRSLTTLALESLCSGKETRLNVVERASELQNCFFDTSERDARRGRKRNRSTVAKCGVCEWSTSTASRW